MRDDVINYIRSRRALKSVLPCDVCGGINGHQGNCWVASRQTSRDYNPISGELKMKYLIRKYTPLSFGENLSGIPFWISAPFGKLGGVYDIGTPLGYVGVNFHINRIKQIYHLLLRHEGYGWS